MPSTPSIIQTKQFSFDSDVPKNPAVPQANNIRNKYEFNQASNIASNKLMTSLNSKSFESKFHAGPELFKHSAMQSSQEEVKSGMNQNYIFEITRFLDSGKN